MRELSLAKAGAEQNQRGKCLNDRDSSRLGVGLQLSRWYLTDKSVRAWCLLTEAAHVAGECRMKGIVEILRVGRLQLLQGILQLHFVLPTFMLVPALTAAEMNG